MEQQPVQFYSIDLSVAANVWSFAQEEQLRNRIKTVGGVFSGSGFGFGYRDLAWEADDKQTAMSVYNLVVMFLEHNKIVRDFSVSVQFWDGNDWEEPIVSTGALE